MAEFDFSLPSPGIEAAHFDMHPVMGRPYEMTVNWSAGGKAVDLKNHLVVLRVHRPHLIDNDVVMLKHGSGLNVDEPTGRIDINLTAQHLALIGYRPAVFDLTLDMQDNDRWLIASGTVVISKGNRYGSSVR